jgi:hypothetical protein
MTTDLAIEIIAYAAVTAIFATCCALLSYLLDFCFYRGNVFAFYLPWLARTIMRNSKYADDRKLVEQYVHARDTRSPYSDADDAHLHAAEDQMLAAAGNHPLYKMLGGCIVCFNIWCAAVTFVGLHFLTGLQWWYMLPYILFASFVLRRVVKM